MGIINTVRTRRKMIPVIFSSQVCTLLFLILSPCSAQAPGDETERCTSAEDAPTYPDTVRNLMDSYNYVQLLPGSGSGNPPIEGAVWTDRSVDGNDAIGTTNPTYVSLQFLYMPC